MQKQKRTLVIALLALALSGILTAVHGQEWVRSGAPTKYWLHVACSTNGDTLIAVQNSARGISISTNFGATWSTTNLPGPEWGPAPEWGGVACSANGTRFYASLHGGPIFTSADSGVTWSAVGPNTKWGPLTCSADGSKIMAPCTDGIYDAPFFVSTNFGVTWANAPLAKFPWVAVACSAYGVNMYALAEARYLFFSRDSGHTWGTGSTLPSIDWESLACSADGTRLIASIRWATIITSTNSGLNWFTNNTPPAGLQYARLASSADGNTLLAAGAGSIYTSTNAGAAWVSNRAPVLSWVAVACSADGNKLLACSTPAAPIYVVQPPPRLSLQSISNQVLISWAASTTGFTLEQNTDLPFTTWSTVTNVTGTNQLTLTPAADRNFYRLRYP